MTRHVKSAAEQAAARVTAGAGDGPAHERLAAALRGLIDDGVLRPGDPLPGDAELVAATGLARGTVRQGVAALRAEGLVQTRQGARTTVLARPRLQPFSELVSFTAWARRAGAEPGARVVELVRRPADPATAEPLRLADGALAWTLTRVRLLDGVPVMVERAAYPEAVGDLLVGVDLERESVYDTLAARGVEVASGHHRISAVGADAETAALLNLRPGEALLRQARTVFGPDGAPLEHSVDDWRGDAIALDAVNSAQGNRLARRPRG